MIKLVSLLVRTPGRRLKRVGRGHGSVGKTSGYGHGGSRKRSGSPHAQGFEGGQTVAYKKIPKRGFTSQAKLVNLCAVINLSRISKFIESGKITNNISLEELRKAKLVSNRAKSCKLLGNGEIKSPISVHGLKVSKLAQSKIEIAGGSVK